VTPCGLVDRYNILLELAASIIRAGKPLLPWRWRKQVLKNVCIFSPDYTVSHSRNFMLYELYRIKAFSVLTLILKKITISHHLRVW
jgi:hypothetical protein